MNAVSDIDGIFGEIFGMIRIKVPYNQLNRQNGEESEVKGYFYLIKRPDSVNKIDNINDTVYPRLILRLYSLNPLADQIAYNQMEASCSGYPLRQYGDLDMIGKEVEEIREYTGDTGDKNIFYGILIKRMLIYFFGCLPLEVESFLKDNSGENLVEKWDYLCYLTNLATQRMMENNINNAYKKKIEPILDQWYDRLKDSGSTDPRWEKYFDPPDYKNDRLWNPGNNIKVGDAPTKVSQMGYRPCGFEIIKGKDDQKTRIKTRKLMSDYQSFSNSETTLESKDTKEDNKEIFERRAKVEIIIRESKREIFVRRATPNPIVEDFCKATNGGDDDNILYGNYYLVNDSQFKSTWPII